MTFIDQLQNYWAVILFIGGVITSWTYFKFELSDLSKRVSELENHNEKNGTAITNLNLWMTKIDTKLDILVGNKK